ncbi:MAG: rhomboid family intramembrane serine protease [Candidatus Acidoferrales bacterium]
MGTYRGWGRPSYRMYGGGYGGYGGLGSLLTPMVKKLIIINAIVFVLTLLLGTFTEKLAGLFIREFGLVPEKFIFGLRLWQPVTYLFLHGGFWHLFFNMFALWMFGSTLERDWGSRRFLRYYLFTGVGAGLFSVLMTAATAWLGWATQGQPLMSIPTIGASGAIYGILLAFGLLYPNVPIYIWGLFPIPARIFVLIFGVMAFMSALRGPGSGVSHVAHLGGMLLGLFYLYGGVRGLYKAALRRYVNWRMKQARRKFDVYMREQDEEDIPPRHDRWIH